MFYVMGVGSDPLNKEIVISDASELTMKQRENLKIDL